MIVEVHRSPPLCHQVHMALTFLADAGHLTKQRTVARIPYYFTGNIETTRQIKLDNHAELFEKAKAKASHLGYDLKRKAKSLATTNQIPRPLGLRLEGTKSRAGREKRQTVHALSAIHGPDDKAESTAETLLAVALS